MDSFKKGFNFYTYTKIQFLASFQVPVHSIGIGLKSGFELAKTLDSDPYYGKKKIIRLYEVFESYKHFLLVMEYGEGGDLLQLVKKNKKIEEQ